MATTVRVSLETRSRAASLARTTGSSIGDVVSRALDAYEVAIFWDETREALSRRESGDDDGWDITVRDGLADE